MGLRKWAIAALVALAMLSVMTPATAWIGSERLVAIRGHSLRHGIRHTEAQRNAIPYGKPRVDGHGSAGHRVSRGRIGADSVAVHRADFRTDGNGQRIGLFQG